MKRSDQVTIEYNPFLLCYKLCLYFLSFEISPNTSSLYFSLVLSQNLGLLLSFHLSFNWQPQLFPFLSASWGQPHNFTLSQHPDPTQTLNYYSQSTQPLPSLVCEGNGESWVRGGSHHLWTIVSLHIPHTCGHKAAPPQDKPEDLGPRGTVFVAQVCKLVLAGYISDIYISSFVYLYMHIVK